LGAISGKYTTPSREVKPVQWKGQGEGNTCAARPPFLGDTAQERTADSGSRRYGHLKRGVSKILGSGITALFFPAKEAIVLVIMNEEFP
jgi:hypothetical protein